MAAPWIWSETSSPSSFYPQPWVFYIISEIAGQHRPLAAALCNTVVSPVQHILRILSDPINRVAIESERALAVSLFLEHGHDEDKVRSPYITPNTWGETLPIGTTTPSDFLYNQRLLPLRTIYQDSKTYRGAAVIDITHLESPRYGIVVLNNSLQDSFDFDPWGDDVWTDVTPPEKELSQQPLSALGYVEDFEPNHSRKEARELESIPLIDAAAIEFIWPPSSSSAVSKLLTREPIKSPPRSLRALTLITLIKSTRQIGNFNTSIFDGPRQIPGFQNMLRQAIHDNPGLLGRSHATGQLLGLAFGGSQHLDLLRLEQVSAEIIRGALEMEELQKTTSISLCLDALVSTPAEIIDVLASAPSLRDMYFLQALTSDTDNRSAQVFLELCKRPYLFERGRIFMSESYRAALNKKFWLPKSNGSNLPFNIFPIQHVFLRDQTNGCRGKRPDPMFQYTPHYVGDCLFRPEAFVAGLIQWIVRPDHRLGPLATSPPSLDDMSRIEISPAPPRVVDGAKVDSFTGFRRKESWPEMRDLVPGSWSVVISRCIYVDHKLESESRLVDHQFRRFESFFWKCAFVRHRVHIPLDFNGATESMKLRAEDVEVVGINEFLKITAPHVDAVIIFQRLEELELKLEQQEPAPLGPGMHRLSVLGHQEACALLDEFIAKGREGKEYLRNHPTESGSDEICDW
ncbi:hypothetical protein GQX73_g1924 [Xylaria multiplex]|uniref:Uncharacterized protein n=1 Tax=Xylaria multiplex TaxID=323545 RepID=A0A7C8MR59_9PEZI|nr:hypothetical protein GQX73_g1924 [Xylaria multiplex]